MNIYKLSDIILVNSFIEHTMYLVTIANKSIVIYLNKEGLFAFSAKCPHGGTLLTEGYIDAKNCIVCPTHFYKFNLHTGREVLGKEYRLKVYKTFLKEGEWYIEI